MEHGIVEIVSAGVAVAAAELSARLVSARVHSAATEHVVAPHYHVVPGNTGSRHGQQVSAQTKFVLKLKLQAGLPLPDHQTLWLLTIHAVAADHLKHRQSSTFFSK